MEVWELWGKRRIDLREVKPTIELEQGSILNSLLGLLAL